VLAAALLLLLAQAACAPAAPAADTFTLKGTLERNGLSAAATTAVPVSFGSVGARGEWWPCDARFTGSACVDDKHVNVFLSLPNITDLDGLGQNACVIDGTPHGVFETLLQKATAHAVVQVPGDVEAFVLVASDKDGSGAANLDSDDETSAVSALASGTLQLLQFETASDPVSFQLHGTTRDGHVVDVAFQGATSSTNVVPLDKPATCASSALRSP
jgi:hypothetical protein